MYDPNSPYFHQFLTPSTFADMFAYSAQDYQSVTDWLNSRSLTVNTTFADRILIEVHARAVDVENAFSVDLSTYRAGTETFFSNSVDPILPASVGTMVSTILGLNNITSAEPNSPPYCLSPCTPSDIRSQYDVQNVLNVGYPGSGQKIAIVDAYDYPNLISDLAYFDGSANGYNLPSAPLIDEKSFGTTQCPAGTSTSGSWCRKSR